MALLKIIKLSAKVWKHNSDVDGDFILTKFYAKDEFNKFLIVETYGSKRREYSINEIEVYNIGGGAETFSNFEDLFLRLEELNYVGFYQDGDAPNKQDKDISLYGDIPLPLEDTDKLWINRSGTWYKVDKSELGGGEAFVKKSYAQTYVDSITTGADASVPIPANGSSCIRLGNASLTSVACLNLSAIIGNSNAEVPYPGKIFEIMNGTGSDVEIKHATGSDIQFTTKDGNSIIIPNNESLFVKYDADGLLELFRSWSEVDLSNKADLVGGKVPASQLPSYVDDVIEGYYNGTNFYTDALFTNLITPESSKIYVALDTNLQYRWSGSGYVQIGGIQGVFLGSVTPTDTPTGTGEAFWNATEEGTYTNFGGVVVAANSMAFISRDASGVFSISQTPLDLTDYAQKEVLTKEYNPFIPTITGGSVTTNVLRKVILGVEIQSISINPSLFYSFATIFRTSTSVTFNLYSATSSTGSGFVLLKTFTSTDITNKELLIINGADSILVNPTLLPIADYYSQNYLMGGLQTTVFEKDNSLALNKVKYRYIDISSTLISVENKYINTSGNIVSFSSFSYSKEFVISPKGNYYLTLSAILAGDYAIVAYYDVNMTFISSYNQTNVSPITKVQDYKLVVPSNARFMRISRRTTEVITLKTDAFTTFMHTIPVDDSADNKFILPKYIDVAVGSQCNIYFDNIARTKNFRENGLLKIEGALAMVVTDNELKYKPTATGANITTVLRKTDLNLLEKYSSIVTFRSPSSSNGNASEKNIMLVGDSLTDNNYLPAEVFSLLNTNGDYIFNQIGTRINASTKHEGRGGWSWSNYLSGTAFLGITNAFWIGGKLDFQAYCATNSFSGLDYVIINLGTNDIGDNTKKTEAQFNTIIANAKLFIDALLSPTTGYPNCKVAICLPAYGAPYYRAGYSTEVLRYNLQNLNRKYLSNFDDGLYHSNVTCLGINLWIHDKNSYQYTEQAISNRVSETERIYTDVLHPQPSGYYQFADAYHGKIRAFLNGLL